MTIKSRAEFDDTVAGSGPYTMRVTYTQLQLLGALLHITSLGKTTYPQAAYELSTTVEDLMGDPDFGSDSFKAVHPKIVITNYDTNTSQHFDGGDAEIKV